MFPLNYTDIHICAGANAEYHRYKLKKNKKNKNVDNRDDNVVLVVLIQAGARARCPSGGLKKSKTEVKEIQAYQ